MGISATPMQKTACFQANQRRQPRPESFKA
jgi:hypothetical protein